MPNHNHHYLNYWCLANPPEKFCPNPILLTSSKLQPIPRTTGLVSTILIIQHCYLIRRLPQKQTRLTQRKLVGRDSIDAHRNSADAHCSDPDPIYLQASVSSKVPFANINTPAPISNVGPASRSISSSTTHGSFSRS